jgi:phenol 2-monooxygenase
MSLIRSKYIVGADGARSPVRRIAEIPFIGERTGNKWIRLDATVRTNMPSPRSLNSVQSETHGLVLWCPIDEGKTRIGFVWNASLQEKYGEDGATAENVMAEAKKAVAPFTLEFKILDWHTLYGIGQCIGATFVKGRVLLAGDAVHTHSSGSAQGLNTGTFDATNMAWKLALVLKGAAGPELLESYNEERRNSVQQMIDNDKIISSLISGVLPTKFEGRKDHPRDILDEFFENAKTIAFTLGLGVSYGE